MRGAGDGERMAIGTLWERVEGMKGTGWTCLEDWLPVAPLRRPLSERDDKLPQLAEQGYLLPFLMVLL